MADLFYTEHKDSLDLFIKNALNEDIENGDITSKACIPKESIKSRFIIFL